MSANTNTNTNRNTHMNTHAQPSTTQPRRRRLVTTFGLGGAKEWDQPKSYQAVRYVCDGRDSAKTSHIQAALAELFAVTSIGGVTTPEVAKEWVRFVNRRADDIPLNGDRLGRDAGLWSSLSNQAEIPADHPFPIVHLTEVNSQQESSLYQTFNAYRALLSHEALPHLGEEEPPEELIFDVTHGFRTQPIIGLAAALFTLQEWERIELRGHVPRLRVLYGAFEDKSLGDDRRPVWDITPFLGLQQLNNALSDLIRYGRAEALGEALDDLSATPTGDLAWLAALRESTRAVSDDLHLIRTRDLATQSAPRLAAEVAKALEHISAGELKERWGMLEETLKALKSWSADFTLPPEAPEGLGGDRLVSRDGLELMQRLAARYQALGSYPALLATMAEGWISYEALRQGRAERGSQPNQDFAPLRNTVMHAQFSQKGDRAGDSSQDLLGALGAHLEDFRALSPSVSPPKSSSSGRTLLLTTSAKEYDNLTTLDPSLKSDLTAQRRKNITLDGKLSRITLWNYIKRYGESADWVMSPSVAADPRLSVFVSTCASQLKRPLSWCVLTPEGALSREEQDFSPARWLQDE